MQSSAKAKIAVVAEVEQLEPSSIYLQTNQGGLVMVKGQAKPWDRGALEVSPTHCASLHDTHLRLAQM